MTFTLSTDKGDNTRLCREWALKRELPELAGTEKQVTWAEALRYDRCIMWAKSAACLKEEYAKPERDKILEVLRTETNARFYIESRYCDNILDAVKQWEQKGQ